MMPAAKPYIDLDGAHGEHTRREETRRNEAPTHVNTSFRVLSANAVSGPTHGWTALAFMPLARVPFAANACTSAADAFPAAAARAPAASAAEAFPSAGKAAGAQKPAGTAAVSFGNQ
jgi:hypothetical protein